MIRSLLAAAAAAFLVAHVAAQAPLELAPQAAAAFPLPAVVPIHTAPDDPIGGAYGVWTAGHGFKASFHDGFVFHGDDRLGRTSVALTLAACRIGAEWSCEPARPPEPRWTATRCELDHGPVVEAYDVHAHGIEQTFVLRERPTAAGAGDLVCELTIASTLQPRQLTGGEVQFVDAAGTWRVAYGAATAIDANGVRRTMRSELAGDRIRLVCDGEWLAHAAWPVTVDPLLQPNPALIVAPRVVDVDLLRDDDETVRNLWVAITVETASGDRDLIVRRFDAGLTNGVDVFTDVTTLWKVDQGRLAASGGEAKVALVLTRDFGTSRAVRWQLRDKADVTLVNSVASLNAPAGTHDWRGDAGGTRAFSMGRHLLLVWQRETTPAFQNTTSSRAFAALLDASAPGNGTLSTPFRLDPRDDQDQEKPTVTPEAEGGAAFSWITAWRARGPSVQPFHVHARRIGNDGNHGTRYDAPSGFFLLTQGDPRVAGADGRYLLAYGHGSSSSGGFVELVVVRLDWPHGTAVAALPHGSFSPEAGSPTNLLVDDVAYDNSTRSHWVVTRRDLTADTIRATKLGFRGREIEHGELVYPFQETARHSAVVFDDDENTFLVLGATEHSTATQPGRLHLARLEFDAVAAPAEYGTTCTQGRMRWHGTQHIGDELTSTDIVQGTPLTATILAFATAPLGLPLDVLGAPQCTLLVDVFGPGALTTLAGVTDSGGRMVLPLPLPENLAPLQLHLQAVQLTASPTALTVTTTRGLRVELGR